MNANNEFLSDVLIQGSRAFAGYAADELLSAHPETEKGFEPDPFSGWQNWLAIRVDELAAAVFTGRPHLFLSQVYWGKTILQSRGISPESFRKGLNCLREVLGVELPDPVRTLAIEYLDGALEKFDASSIDLTSRLQTETKWGSLISNYLLMLLEGNRLGAGRLILDALNAGNDVRELYLEVLLPVQEELGRMWASNEINVAEEHFVSQATKNVMSQLLPHAQLQPSNGKTMLAASLSGNQHDIGLQVVADFFEIEGWRSILLGANVPTRDLVEAIDCFEADLIGISVSQITQLVSLKKAIDAIKTHAKRGKIKILLGGAAFQEATDLPMELGADAYAADPAAAVALGRQMLGLEQLS